MEKIKNNTVALQTFHGQEIMPGEYYVIQPTELTGWANDSIVLTAIANSDAIMNDGDSDITDVNDAIDFLKDHVLMEVVTQFEKDDKTLKIVSSTATVDEFSEATILLKIPGVMANGDGRWVSGGEGWFDSIHKDDRIIELEVVDVDDVLGGGAGAMLKAYCDDDMPESNEGGRICLHTGTMKIESMGGYGWIPAQLYLKIMAKKGGDITTGTFYCNIQWAKSG